MQGDFCTSLQKLASHPHGLVLLTHLTLPVQITNFSLFKPARRSSCHCSFTISHSILNICTQDIVTVRTHTYTLSKENNKKGVFINCTNNKHSSQCYSLCCDDKLGELPQNQAQPSGTRYSE